MERVNRSALYTSLEQRIKYMHRFLEFGQDDIDTLIAGQKFIKELIPLITDKVYEKLLSQDITARIFHTHDSRVEEDPETFLKPSDPQTSRRKMFLRWYLTKLNSDPSTMEYWAYLNKVGRLHIGQGKSAPVFVEYALLGTCLGYIQGIINEAILNHHFIGQPFKIALIKALGKVIWIQNDLLARWHTEENRMYSIEQRDEQKEVSVSTPLLTPPATSADRTDDPDYFAMKPPTCPFSGKIAAAASPACAFTGKVAASR